jgi:hypothetical protein
LHPNVVPLWAWHNAAAWKTAPWGRYVVSCVIQVSKRADLAV